MNTCSACGQNFEVTSIDDLMLERLAPVIAGQKFALPTPHLCPACRSQRRLAFRNDRRLYRTVCAFSKKNILAVYGPESPFVVYDRDIWWSDKWDPKSYGRDMDFSRPFFEQFHELMLAVPRASLASSDCEDCPYTNQIAQCKNCYLLSSATNDIHCYYGHRVSDSEYCCDCLMLDHSSLCYECIASDNCHRSAWLKECEHCADSRFLEDCRGCTDCLFCVGLEHASYQIWNKQYTKEEFERRRQEFDFTDHDKVQRYQQEFTSFQKTFPQKGPRLRNAEGCTGDDLTDCTECFEVYAGVDCQNARFCHYAHHVKDIMDVHYAFEAERNYEVCNTGLAATNIYFCLDAWPNVADLYYCDNTMQGSRDCFGCSGLRGVQYCILNKQYSKEAYEILVPQIITHMQKTGEWGEFFPMALSPFPYNDSVAHEEQPLTATQAEAQGLRWREEKPPLVPATTLTPELSSSSYNDSAKAQELLGGVLICEVSGQPFRIISQELSLYLQLGIPIPRRHPDQRHKDRLLQKST